MIKHKVYKDLNNKEINIIEKGISNNNNPLVKSNFIYRYLHRKYSVYIFFYSEGEIVGVINFFKFRNDCSIDFLYVREKFIRQGYADKLIDEVLKRYTHNKIEFELDKKNKRYKSQFKFYAAKGFVFKEHTGHNNIKLEKLN